jgi:putative holliday junction resolvase
MKQIAKILSLDLGLSRIGVAISDGEVVGSLPVIDSHNREQAIGQILEIVRNEEISKIILGLPIGQNNSEDVVRSFALELNKTIDIPIIFEDETLTSKEAERILKNSKLDPKSKKYKEEVDKISAKLILEQYLKNGF